MKKLYFILIGLMGVVGTLVAEDAKVSLENILSQLKLQGRAAVGYFDSGFDGSYGHGTFEVPDVRLAFKFTPDEKLAVTVRLNLNNAAAQVPLADYVFIQSKDFLKLSDDAYWNISGRLGRFKLGFGEENWDNNMVESALPSNSAGDVGALDEGLELSGKFWVFSVSNGSRGVISDSSESKAWMGKLFYTLKDALYVSATGYHSGELKASNSELSIAGLSTPSTGSLHWTRAAVEMDARYDIGKGKKTMNPTVMSDSTAVVKASCGAFEDNADQGVDRDGLFGFVEGMWNVKRPFFVAARASVVNLSGGQTAVLNGVTANYYQRYSLGGGYRWSENTIVKLGYDFNVNGGEGSPDKNDNLLSTLIGIRF